MLIAGGFFGIAIIALVSLIFLVRHEIVSSKAGNIDSSDNADIQNARNTVATQAVEPEEHEKKRVSASTMPLSTFDVPTETAQINTSGHIPIVQAPMPNEQVSTGGHIPEERSAREDEQAWLNEQIREMEVDIAILTQQARDFVKHIDTLRLILIQLEQRQKQAETNTNINQGKEEEDTG